MYTDLTEGGLEARAGNFSNAVFPNPASNQLNVRFDAAFNGMINLVALDGRILASEYFASEYASVASLNVENVPAGMYILSLNDGSAIQTYSVSVQ